MKFEPIGDWPMADESIGTRDVASHAQLRRADPRDAAHGLPPLPQLHPRQRGHAEGRGLLAVPLPHLRQDARRAAAERRSAASGPARSRSERQQLIDEQFDPEGQKAIRKRDQPLFEEVKKKYTTRSSAATKRSRSRTARWRSWSSELAKYDFGRTDVDAKGAAYQEIVGTNLRGDRGQYFTPRGAIKLDGRNARPEAERARARPGVRHRRLPHRDARAPRRTSSTRRQSIEPGDESTEEFLSIQERLSDSSKQNLFGADFDPFLVRAAQMNVVMASNARRALFHMNSLEFPAGHLPGVDGGREASGARHDGRGDDEPAFRLGYPHHRSRTSCRHYELAHIWERTDDGGFRNTGRLQGSVAPEVLFIERCLDWLKPGGRMGIVLPDGILGNPGDEYIRWWILRHCWVLASVDLPVEVFIVEANVNILTSLLFLKKKTERGDAAPRTSGRRTTTRCSWPWPRRSASIAAATRSTSAAPTARRSSRTSRRSSASVSADSRSTGCCAARRRRVDDDLPGIADGIPSVPREEHGAGRMKIKTIPSAWLPRDGRRLDCGPYMSGALEAKVRLEGLSCAKEASCRTHRGHAGGIYNGPQFARTTSMARSTEFRSSASSRCCTRTSQVSPCSAEETPGSAKTSYLRVEPGMTLISCSGTIGRMVYVRSRDGRDVDVAGHIMKVVPDRRRSPGLPLRLPEQQVRRPAGQIGNLRLHHPVHRARAHRGPARAAPRGRSRASRARARDEVRPCERPHPQL